MINKKSGALWGVGLSLLAFLWGVLFVIQSKTNHNENSLVVYCAHDALFSQQIFTLFEKETGIKIIPKFDTEDTKSLALLNLIIKEQNNPRCDVLWNNELLGTVELKKQNLLIPYKSSNWKRFPDKWKDLNGYWCGFAGRMRVYIGRPEITLNSLLFKQENLKNGAIAKPIYGTTLTHFTALFKELGKKEAIKEYTRWKKRGISLVNGNGAVKRLVAENSCQWGWTDTDDFFVAKDKGADVKMSPIPLPSGKTILIPNTVSIIKGTKKLSLAKRFVDFLLSEKCEIALANSQSRQIPLGTLSKKTDLSNDVKRLLKWSNNSISLKELSNERKQCLTNLKF